LERAKGPGKSKCNSKTNEPVQTGGGIARPGTFILNRAGLMASKNAGELEPGPESMEVIDIEPSGDNPEDGNTEEAAILVSSQDSPNPNTAHTARKTGPANNQTTIPSWFIFTGSSLGSALNTASSASNKKDARSPATGEKVGQTKPNGKKGNATSTTAEGKKRVRTTSESSPRGFRFRRRIGSYDSATADPPEESTGSPQGKATATVDVAGVDGRKKGKARAQTRESDAEDRDLSEYIDESESMWESDASVD
ncbi:hypothetical protein COCMIDRAFT_110686, partial [Bipolaris oryzae ATCC 44560]